MRKIDYSLGEFMFNGRSSKDFSICIEKAPSFSRPMRSHNIYKVPGRSGDIIEPLDAYENIERSYDIWAANDSFTNAAQDYDSIAEWLYNSNGYCRLEDDFEPGIFRLAYFVGPIDVENLLNMYGRTTITFNCKPEKYLVNGDKPITLTNSAYTSMLNPTKFRAKPFIKLKHNSGTGSVQITGDFSSGTGLQISNVNADTYIDCELMDVYTDTGSKNSDTTGEFPFLDPGLHRIYFRSTGVGVTATLVPRWYTI